MVANDLVFTVGVISTTVGVLSTILGIGTSVYNVRNASMANRWKRADLANAYLRDFSSNPELVFAGRCLEWEGGKIVVPETLRPYLTDNGNIMLHDPNMMASALGSESPANWGVDPRIQIYRVAIDVFLSWLGIISTSLAQNLFNPADIREVTYWVEIVRRSEDSLGNYINCHQYREKIEYLKCVLPSPSPLHQSTPQKHRWDRWDRWDTQPRS